MNDQKSYKPQTVMITGATGDFGTAFAKRFSALGAKLILHGRNEEKLTALKETLPNCEIHTLVFDIADKESTIAQIGAIPSEFQDIDLLINNAGGAIGLDKMHEAPLEDLENMITMNDTSLVRITRLVLPSMTQRKRGHVINIGSTAGNYPYPGGHVYAASKAFVKQFSLSLRSDLVGTNIRVTNIEPGMVETQFSLARFKGDAEKAAAVYAGAENINADDIAEAVTWAACLPPRMNINRLEVMPTAQSFGPFTIERST